jgi:ABC-type multidrug transport system ATPase subunit
LEAIIFVDELTKTFGHRRRVRAVDHLSFAVAPGEAVALWGPNGAGKTTVIKCLLGLLRYEGVARVSGYDSRRHGKSARRMMGYVPQEITFHHDLSVAQTLRFYARLKKVDAARIHEVLEQVELTGHTLKTVNALSGGLKQRLALAIALMADPPVLLLDEPTSNLDTTARDRFLHLLSQITREGKTILFTSHRLDEVKSLADRVLVLEQGRLALTSAAADLAERLGLQTRLCLYLTDGKREQAIDVLNSGGLRASLNGRGVLVDVSLSQKALPIYLLDQADIVVEDFEEV